MNTSKATPSTNRIQKFAYLLLRIVISAVQRKVLFRIFNFGSVYTAELRSWRRHSSSAWHCRSSLYNSGLSETDAWIKAKFYAKLHIHHIYNFFFVKKVIFPSFNIFFSQHKAICERKVQNDIHPIFDLKCLENLLHLSQRAM